MKMLGVTIPGTHLVKPSVISSGLAAQRHELAGHVGDVRASFLMVIQNRTVGVLADRPNGSTGWVHASDVQLTPNPYRLQVRLSDHKITVFQGTNSIYEGQVAIGASDTPTPPGKYYTRVLIQAPDPNTVYGPFAYGLSAHSEVLNEYNGGDAEVGVHGNNDTSVLGKSVTHGCIRMDNDEITKLSKVLPLGTPVEIVS